MMKNTSSKYQGSSGNMTNCSGQTDATVNMYDEDASISDCDSDDDDSMGDLIDELDEIEKEMLQFRSGRAPTTAASTQRLADGKSSDKSPNRAASSKGRSVSPKRRQPRHISAATNPSTSSSKALSSWSLMGSIPVGGNSSLGSLSTHGSINTSKTDVKREEERRAKLRIKLAMTYNGYDQKAEQKQTDAQEDDDDEDSPTKHQTPHDCLKQEVLQDVSTSTTSGETWEGYFQAVTAKRVQSHSVQVAHAIRLNRLQSLKGLHGRGMSLDGCNRHGESMIHLACRLGRLELVHFMIHDAQVNLRVQDDSGRTPLHDACWTNQPNFDLIELIIKQSPELLFVTDKRGFTPLQYIPKWCWKEWCQWLGANKQWLRLKVAHSGFIHTRDVLNEAQQRLQVLLQKAVDYE